MKPLLLVLLVSVLTGCGGSPAAPLMTTSSFSPTPVPCSELMCPPTDPPGTPGDN